MTNTIPFDLPSGPFNRLTDSTSPHYKKWEATSFSSVSKLKPLTNNSKVDPPAPSYAGLLPLLFLLTGAYSSDSEFTSEFSIDP